MRKTGRRAAKVQSDIGGTYIVNGGAWYQNVVSTFAMMKLPLLCAELMQTL